MGKSALRPIKSYNGEMMETARKNEDILLSWLRGKYKYIIDFRDFRLAHRIDVDFGIETLDGAIVLAEIKSDKHLTPIGNLLFENHRINHYAPDHYFYLGWGWRSPAQKLIVRNPNNGYTIVFPFQTLRAKVACYIAEYGKKARLDIVLTDVQKTTFNHLIPLDYFDKSLYQEYCVNGDNPCQQ